MLGGCVARRDARCIYPGTLGMVLLCEYSERLPPACSAAYLGMELQWGPINTPSRYFWAWMAGSTVGSPLLPSTGTAWKYYLLKAEHTKLDIAVPDQEACCQHAGVRGGLAT